MIRWFFCWRKFQPQLIDAPKRAIPSKIFHSLRGKSLERTCKIEQSMSPCGRHLRHWRRREYCLRRRQVLGSWIDVFTFRTDARREYRRHCHPFLLLGSSLRRTELLRSYSSGCNKCGRRKGKMVHWQKIFENSKLTELFELNYC